MEAKINIFERFAYSLYNFKTYKYFIKEKLFKSLIYILVVNTIFSFFVSTKLVNSLNMMTTEFKNILISDVPDFNIENGIFHVDSREPFIYNDIENNLTFILENNNETQKALAQYENAVLVNRNEIIFKAYGTELQRVSFTGIPSLTKSDLLKVIDLQISFFMIITFLIVPVIFIIGHLLSAFIIIGPAAFLLSKSIHLNINYKEACIISIYSLSLPILLTSLLFVAGKIFAGFSIVYYAIAFIYCNIAVNTINQSKNTHINNVL